MPIDFDNDKSRKFDPSAIPKRKSLTPDAEEKNVAKVTKEKEPRSPLWQKLRDTYRNSGIGQRAAIRDETRTVETLAQHVDAKARLAKAEGKLSASEAETYRSQIDSEFVKEDAENEIAHRHYIKGRKRKNELDDLAQKNEWRQHKHEQRMNPRRGKSAEARREQEYRNIRDYGSNGPHMRTYKKVEEETIAKYGSWDDVPPRSKRQSCARQGRGAKKRL